MVLLLKKNAKKATLVLMPQCQGLSHADLESISQVKERNSALIVLPHTSATKMLWDLSLTQANARLATIAL